MQSPSAPILNIGQTLTTLNSCICLKAYYNWVIAELPDRLITPKFVLKNYAAKHLTFWPTDGDVEWATDKTLSL